MGGGGEWRELEWEQGVEGRKGRQEWAGVWGRDRCAVAGGGTMLGETHVGCRGGGSRFILGVFYPFFTLLQGGCARLAS